MFWCCEPSGVEELAESQDFAWSFGSLAASG